MKPSWKPFNEPSNLWELGDLTYFDHPISSPDCGHLLCQAHSSAQRLLSAARPRRSSRRGIVGWNIFWKAWKWVERCWGWSKLDINWTSFDYVLTLSNLSWSFRPSMIVCNLRESSKNQHWLFSGVRSAFRTQSLTRARPPRRDDWRFRCLFALSCLPKLFGKWHKWMEVGHSESDF